MPGPYFDELVVGQAFQHAILRTITETGNVWFMALTYNPAHLHLDEEYCRTRTEFGLRIINNGFTPVPIKGAWETGPPVSGARSGAMVS